MKRKSINSANRLILLFMSVYMVSYITRINYAAIIAEIERETGMPRTALAAALTSSSVFYGAGQFLSGYCGEKFRPKRLIFAGILVSAAMNVVMCFGNSSQLMIPVWCVNGLAQAFLWPPMVRLMVALFKGSDYDRASTVISWGASFGTILVYLAAPAVITLSGWRAVFGISAACGIIMAVIWQRHCPEEMTEEKQEKAGRKEAAERGRVFTPALAAVMLAVMMQGILRDGVTTWMPSYISETYHLSSAVSILTNVVLPVFGILCMGLAIRFYEKFWRNPMQCGGVFFGIGAMAALLLTLLSGHSALGSVFSSALLTGCMHGVNLILICMVPPLFQKQGNVSMVSGLLNSCTYVGSALSTYGIAVLSEHAGWKMTSFAWCLVAVLGMGLCFLSMRAYQQERGKKYAK